MTKLFLFKLSIIVLLTGCGPEENPEQLRAVNESLERVNNSTRQESKFILEVLRDKQKDPQFIPFAESFFTKANKMHLFTDSLIIMIEGVKKELITQSDSLKQEYASVIRELRSENGIGSKLFKTFASFKDSVHPVDPYLLTELPLLPGYSDSMLDDDRIQYEKKWLEKNFNRSSSLMAMIMLNKIENEILTAEKMLVDYCNVNVQSCGLIYDKMGAIAVLSSSYVKQGQSIEVTAGVGGFSTAPKPRVIINGKQIEPNNDNGTAVYSFTANNKPGKYNAMVEIEYSRSDGSRGRLSKRLDYIIANEK